MMKIKPVGKHYTYIIKDFDEERFPIHYDKRKFPKWFDAINIDCYGDGTLRQMFLSKSDDWITVNNKSDVEKIVNLIEGYLGLVRN